MSRSEAKAASGRSPASGWFVFGVQLAIVAVVLLVWEALVRAGVLREFFFGKPSDVIRYLVDSTLSGQLAAQAWVTLYEELLGFAIGTVAGTATGLALWWTPYLSRLLEPFAVVFNATPKIVVAPILIVWFGIGLLSKVMIAVLICAIVAWLGAFDGMRSADPDQIDMLRAVGARRRDVFLKIIVPSSLPWIFATARVNVGLALIGVITGEFLSSTSGLGYLVDKTSKLYLMSDTLGALFAIAVLAALQLFAVNWAEARLLPWSSGTQREPDVVT